MAGAVGLRVMRRWHLERSLMLRRWREEVAKHEYPGYPPCGLAPVPPQGDPDTCHCYRGMGVLRKRKPYDCGNSRCPVCHLDKFYYPKRRADRRRRAIALDLAADGW